MHGLQRNFHGGVWDRVGAINYSCGIIEFIHSPVIVQSDNGYSGAVLKKYSFMKFANIESWR